MTTNHDIHYKLMPIEPFDVMEQRVKMHLEGEHIGDGHPPPPAKLAMAMALKYIMRAGNKDGQPWEKDVEKAMNYLNRALTGKWISPTQ